MKNFPDLNNCTIAIIGLGYVGLPLAVEFSKLQNSKQSQQPLNRQVIGFDINPERIEELIIGIDRTKEVNQSELKESSNLQLTNNKQDLIGADVFIITVPTPIDDAKRPYLTPLKDASIMVGRILKERAKLNNRGRTLPIVIYESTVYPGATEEICVPILEKESGLVFNEDDASSSFVCGYSPERINPGDKKHRLTTITKVTSGSTKATGIWIDELYASIISVGTHLAPNIKVAEAAKVIENTQRDLNIALVNELSMICKRIGIDTLDVLEAAGTKWNFLPFKPGLVGGHCIGVDPYYLTHKAEQLGYYPQVVLAGRRINDGMGSWIVEQLILEMAKRKLSIG